MNDLFFFNDTATTEIYTLSLHDALPISGQVPRSSFTCVCSAYGVSNVIDFSIGMPWTLKWLMSRCTVSPSPFATCWTVQIADRKSTRLNSSHANISYAVFCLKKKNIYSY